MSEFNAIDIIQSVGFPIFMCLYFVFRFEKVLTKNTEALRALIIKIK